MAIQRSLTPFRNSKNKSWKLGEEDKRYGLQAKGMKVGDKISPAESGLT